MSWNFTAADPPKGRERFSRPLVVAGIVAGFVGLLALFYPEQELLQILRQDGRRVPTTRVYLQAVLRARPADHQSRFGLARLLVEAGDYRQALQVLDSSVGTVTAVEGDRYRALQYEALVGLVRKEKDTQARQRLYATADALLQAGSAAGLVRRIAADADSLKATELAGRARAVLARLAPGDPALYPGDTYQQRAEAAFAAMQQATDRDERRTFFLQGVRVLQEGNLYKEAVDAADRHIGSLADDRETLVALTRIALATGYPDRAQRYIRRALGMGGR